MYTTQHKFMCGDEVVVKFSDTEEIRGAIESMRIYRDSRDGTTRVLYTLVELDFYVAESMVESIRVENKD